MVQRNQLAVAATVPRLDAGVQPIRLGLQVCHVQPPGEQRQHLISPLIGQAELRRDPPAVLARPFLRPRREHRAEQDQQHGERQLTILHSFDDDLRVVGTIQEWHNLSTAAAAGPAGEGAAGEVTMHLKETVGAP
jgi:hypothetical protein